MLPFFVLTKDYDKATRSFDLFVGSNELHAQLGECTLPAGIYGKVVVKPKLGFLWGLAIGEAKRYFYAQWLPASDYDALNMEYELHTEQSVQKKPEIALYFAIIKKR